MLFNEIKWLNLQLFAGEGGGGAGAAGDGGGEGAATGANTAADAGQQGEQRLRELGVPQHVLEKRAKRTAKQTPAAAARTTAAPQEEAQTAPQQAASAAENTEESAADSTPVRMSWDEIMADPEYNKQMQNVVQARLRTAKAAEDNLAKLTPALEVLARQNGLDPANIDYEALAKVIDNDNRYYEDMAFEKGETVEKTKADDQQARAEARQKREELQTLEQKRVNDHINRLLQQGEELKKTFPDFDFFEECRKNPAFARMTAPNVGLSVEDAYYAVHRNEIQQAAMQVTAQKAAQKISKSIQAGQQRPAENGIAGQGASVTTFNYRTASREQREALKRRILEAHARGEKIYPGQ